MAAVKRQGGHQNGGSKPEGVKGNVSSVSGLLRANQTIAALAAVKYDMHLTRVNMKDMSRRLDRMLAMTMALCNHMGIDPDNLDLDPTPDTASTHSMDSSPATGFLTHDIVSRDAGTNNNLGSEDEEPSQVRPSLILRLVESDYDTHTPIQEEQGIDAASQTSDDKHNVTDILAELQGRMDRFEEWKKKVDQRLNDAGL